MPVVPRPLLTLGADLLSYRTARRLRQPRTALPAQAKALAHLTSRLAATEQGRQAGLPANSSYARFAAALPPRTYEGYAPAIERMKKGASGVLWPGTCAFYAVSSGTTAGRTKYLPITEEMLRHFRHAGIDSLLYYTARRGHAGVFRGKHLFLGGSTTLTPLPESQPFTAYAGDLSGITALNLPGWCERHLYEPGTTIAQLADWPAKIAAITERCLRRDITLLAGIPSWLLILAEALMKRAARDGGKMLHLQAIWPNLECLVHGGVPLGPFEEQLRSVLGPGVHFHEVYPASEGFIAVQDADGGRGLRLLTDVGLFYEFIPVDRFDDTNPAASAPHAVPLEGVRTGVDYVLLLTTPAGLARYVLGDVVRFTSTEPPRLVYVGRTKLQLSAFGEHVIEKEVTDALATVCNRHRWHLVNFHVAPLFVNAALGQTRGRHEWWIELKAPMVETPTGPALAIEIDAELQRLNEDYEAKRQGGGLEPPLVRLVMPGVFESWMRQRGKWGGQNKMPRCRSDRAIADELGQLARFSSES